MKRILIVTPSLRHGGTNRSLWNFLNTKDGESYSVDILAMEHDGPYQDKFKRFSLLPENKLLASLFSPENTIGFRKIERIYYKVLFKIILRGNRQRLFRIVARHIDSKKYDAVVAFQEGLTTEFVSCLSAQKRIAWVRCDYENYLRLANRTNETALYNCFDRIVCVSQYTAKVFASHYPHLCDRICSIYNIIDACGIIESSKNDIQDDLFSSDRFTLVSVGRMDAVKRFAAIPYIAKELINSGCDFRWYIIGSGGVEEQHVRNAIKECDVMNEVVLLGSRDNPYPYISAADVLVCPSSTEACPNVVNEAKILHIPVVTADFASAPEYIEHNRNGVIVPLENMANTIRRLYKDTSYYGTLKKGVSSFTYDNDKISRELDLLF